MMLRRLACLFAAGIAVPLAAVPEASAQLTCRVDQKNMAVAELMFGRKIGDRIGVSNTAWTHFLDTEITTRFPDGLTVTLEEPAVTTRWEAHCVWRAAGCRASGAGAAG